MRTVNIKNNPWNECETLAELCSSKIARDGGDMNKGFRLYRRAQLAMEIALEMDPGRVDAEAWVAVARADLAKASWAFHYAKADEEVMDCVMKFCAELDRFNH